MLFNTLAPLESVQIPEPTAISADLVAGVLGDYYKAEVKRIIDGDTFIADINLNRTLQLRSIHVRLARIDADKLGTESGNAAAARLYELVSDKTVVLKTFSDRTDKYGRTLAEVYLPDTRKNVNNLMLEEGFARNYPGEGKTK